MRKICTFNLDVNVVQDMNNEIRRGYRSDYVERAIKEKLKRQTSYDLFDIKTLRLVNHLRMFRYSELTKLELTMLEDIVHRLEDSN